MKKLFFHLGLVLSSMTALAAAPAMVVAQEVTTDIESGLCAGASLRFEGGTGCEDTDDSTQKLNNLIRSIINLLSVVVGVVAVVMIIVGGLRYITSGGNDTSVTSAKNTILYAIIGLIIVALAQVLVRFTLNRITNS